MKIAFLGKAPGAWIEFLAGEAGVELVLVKDLKGFDPESFDAFVFHGSRENNSAESLMLSLPVSHKCWFQPLPIILMRKSLAPQDHNCG